MSSNYNSSGRNGGRGRGGGRGVGKGASDAGRGNNYFQRSDDNSRKLTVFALRGDPPSATTQQWMEAMVDHGRTKYRNGLHKLCDPEKETPKPVIPQVQRPSRRGQIYTDLEDERINILRQENLLDEDAAPEEMAAHEEWLRSIAVLDADDQFQTELEIWKIKAKQREEKCQEVVRDSLEMFGHMWQHLTPACRLALEEKYGKDHFSSEDPKVLADSIREYFIGREKGADGNQMAVEAARRRYQIIEQRFDESVAAYQARIAQEQEILIRQEVISNVIEYEPGTNIRAEKQKTFSEPVRVQHFVFGLNPIKFEEWKRQLTWSPNMYPMPDTMQEAYRQAVDWEEQFKLKHKKGDGYPGIKAGVYVSKEGAGGKKHKPTYRPAEFDSNGVKICWKWRDTKTCDRGKDCPFSHNKPVAANSEKNEQINKAAREVKFDPPMAGGGPSGPKKG